MKNIAIDHVKTQLSEQHNYLRTLSENATKAIFFACTINAACGAWAVHQQRTDGTPHFGIATTFIIVNLTIAFLLPKEICRQYDAIQSRIETLLQAVVKIGGQDLENEPALLAAMTPVEEWKANVSKTKFLFLLLAILWGGSFFISLPSMAN